MIIQVGQSELDTHTLLGAGGPIQQSLHVTSHLISHLQPI